MLDKTYKHWGPPFHQGGTEQPDWEPQLGLASYPAENLETNDNHENTELKVKNKLLENPTNLPVTVFVLTHSSAHSFLQVFRHELGDPWQDICDTV